MTRKQRTRRVQGLVAAKIVHQPGAVILELSHLSQQHIEVFLEENSIGMGIAESLPGTTHGFPEEWLSLIQFSLILE